MFTELKINSESGAVLIIAVIIMSVAVVFIAAMNNIIAPMLHSEQEQELELQLQYLAEAGLAQRLQKVEEGTIALGESDWEELGTGEYKTDVDIADGDYLYLSSTARIDDVTETVSTKHEINKEELYFEDFSSVKPALNLAGEGYTRTNYGESQISDEFTIEAWVKLDETGINNDKYILSGYNDIDTGWFGWRGEFEYSKPYSLYLERHGNRVNLIGEVETWIDNDTGSDEREYLTIEVSDVEELADNQWVHLAFSGQGPTREEGNNLDRVELSLYVDGEEQESKNISNLSDYQYLHTNYWDYIEKNIALGAGFDDAGGIIDNYLPGQIRDIRIWDEKRSDSDIRDKDNRNSYLSGEEDRLVTYYPINDPPDESVSGQVMDFAADNHASKEGEVEYSLTKDWFDTGFSSLDNLMVEVDEELLVASDLIWFYADQSFDYDEDSLYKIEFRIKQADSSETGTDYFRLGVEGLDEAGDLVNVYREDSHEDQYYTALMDEKLADETDWETFSGYFNYKLEEDNGHPVHGNGHPGQGNGPPGHGNGHPVFDNGPPGHNNGDNGSSAAEIIYATVKDNNPASTIIHNPMPLNYEVDKFRPVIIANYNNDESDDFATAKIDYVKIEKLEIDIGR